jgi:hypothetical protein
MNCLRSWSFGVGWWNGDFTDLNTKQTLLLPVTDEIFFSKAVYDRIPKRCKLYCIHFCLSSLQQQDQMGKLSHHNETPKKRVDFGKKNENSQDTQKRVDFQK